MWTSSRCDSQLRTGDFEGLRTCMSEPMACSKQQPLSKGFRRIAVTNGKLSSDRPVRSLLEDQFASSFTAAGCDGMLPLSAALCCHWRHSRCTIILPPGAIQSCHLIRSGLDCQIQLSEAAWRLRSEQQAVRCGLPVIQPQCETL